MKDTLTICKVFLIGCIVLYVFMVGCYDTTADRKAAEPASKSSVDQQRPDTRKKVDTQRSTVKSVPPADTLSKTEIDKATQIKTWLKKKGYKVTQYSVSKNGSTGMALGFGSTVTVNEVTLLNIGNSKVSVTVQNIGTATFTIDKNGELQPAK